MKKWFVLYKNDLKSLLFILLVMVLLSFGWQFFLSTRNWSYEVLGFLGLFPLSGYPLLMLLLGYQSFRKEWRDDTMYFLLSLPRRGWTLILSKVLSVFSVVLIFFGFHLLFYFLLQREAFQLFNVIFSFVSVENPVLNIILLGAGFILWGLVLYMLAQFSYLIASFYHRFRWLVSIIVFIISYYLLQRLTFMLGVLFSWLPSYSVYYALRGESIHDGPISGYILLETAPLAGGILAVLLFLGFGSYLLEKHLEV